MNKRFEKWSKDFVNSGKWDTSSKRSVQEKEAKIIIKWLLDLNLEEYPILEIGCGNGYLGSMIISYFLDNNIRFSYQFSDLIQDSLEVVKKNNPNLSRMEEVSFKVLDVYEADKSFKSGSVPIIISTGYVSAATYKKAVPVVSKILEEEGVLIADFINHFSPAVFLPRPIASIKHFFNLLFSKGKEKPYHFGFWGIKKEYSNYGLKLLKKKYIRLRRNPLLVMFRKTKVE